MKLYFPEDVDWSYYENRAIVTDYRNGDWYYTPREIALLPHINDLVPIEEVRRQCPFELTKEENLFYARALQQVQNMRNEGQEGVLMHLYNPE